MVQGKISVRGLKLFYSGNQALKNIDMEIGENRVTALIGPSGCGKSTFLKCLNRMNDLAEHVRMEGKVLLETAEIVYETMRDGKS
ncbi:MAG: ATP-binding cassette domain-containing protein [Oscillospiraceae bacterium]|nr:ATP-binding cassette domain-containing protein [Oscillospiraceae bacterium]